MIRIQSETKRAYLRQIAEGAKTSAVTLKAALIAVQASIINDTFKKGRIVVATSGNGQSVSFTLGAAGFTPDVVAGMTEEFINVLDDTVAQGYATNGTSESEIDALFSAMTNDDRLRGVSSQLGDITGLRFQSAIR